MSKNFTIYSSITFKIPEGKTEDDMLKQFMSDCSKLTDFSYVVLDSFKFNGKKVEITYG